MSFDLASLRLSDFKHGTPEERQAFANNLFANFSSSGCIRLTDHGFSEEDFAQLLEWNHRFFDLPAEARDSIKHIAGPNPQRGWSTFGSENTGSLSSVSDTLVKSKDKSDAKEHFDIGSKDDQVFANKWPAADAIPGFKSWMESYFDKCQQITLDLMEALEVAAGIQEGALVKRCQGHASELRLNHYPAIEVQKFDQNMRRIWPHTDFGMITLLVQDGQGGLEVQDPQTPGILKPVTKKSNSELLVNVGDTLERWTNGVLKAALHQVTTPMNVDSQGNARLPPRYSVAFFLKATRETSVGALSHFVTPDWPCRYEDMTALAYQQSRTRMVY